MNSSAAGILGGCAVIETQQSTEALHTVDSAKCRFHPIIALNQAITDSLVVPLSVVVGSELASRFP